MDQTDQELIAAYLRGDEKSLEILIQRHLAPVYRFAYRYVGTAADAEDIAQETFVRTWKNLKKFDQSKNFRTWIFQIAKNLCIDFLRRKKAFAFSAFENADGENTLEHIFLDDAPLPFELSARKELTRTLEAAIDKLPPASRAVVLEHARDQRTFREIATSLGKSLHTVKSQYRRALTALREFLAES